MSTTTRHAGQAGGLSSFAHEGTLVSALIPDGWEAFEQAPQHIRLFGPAHPEHDDYTPTLSITLARPEGFGEEWFDSFCKQSLERLRLSNEGFVLRSAQRLSLSSMVEVHVVKYEGQSEEGLAFSQLQAMAPVDRYRLYLIHAATLLPLAQLHMPIFDQILGSLRMLNPR